MCSWHNWEKHSNQHAGLLGKEDDEAKRVFKVCQGIQLDKEDENPGTDVGYVVDRVGAPGDIALAQLHNGIGFENLFMEIVRKDGEPVKAKTLLHSSHVQMRDKFSIDGFTTGLQQLTCLGRRFQITRQPGARHRHLKMPQGGGEVNFPQDNIAYISAKQGLCSIEQPVQTTKPHIRPSVCGSVLVRTMEASKANDNIEAALGKGECAGMMHFCDLTSKTLLEQGYLVYCDTFDPLIEDGWTVASALEKEMQSSTEVARLDVEETVQPDAEVAYPETGSSPRLKEHTPPSPEGEAPAKRMRTE